MSKSEIKTVELGNSLVVRWLRLRASTARAMGSIPGRGTKIPHAAAWLKKKKTLELVMCSVSIALIRIKYICIKKL